jgi:hypothetical protein
MPGWILWIITTFLGLFIITKLFNKLSEKIHNWLNSDIIKQELLKKQHQDEKDKLTEIKIRKLQEEYYLDSLQRKKNQSNK